MKQASKLKVIPTKLGRAQLGTKELTLPRDEANVLVTLGMAKFPPAPSLPPPQTYVTRDMVAAPRISRRHRRVPVMPTMPFRATEDAE